MKLGRIVLLLVLLLAFKAASAQEITLSRKNISLAKLFEEIKKQTGYDFLYNPNILEKAKPVNVEAVKSPLRTVLDNCFAEQPLTYVIDQRTIIVKEKQVTGSDHSTISGRVVDKYKKPVANASVFLSNATIGGKTDTSGYFRLDNVRSGKYDLVVSMVGFETYHYTIAAAGEDISLRNIELSPKTIGLQEVVVKPRNDKYHAINLYDFKKQFLGSTYLADECRILNPEVLDFDYDNTTNVLHASTNDRFLLIDNEALGYHMRYLLEDFAYAQADMNSVELVQYGASSTMFLQAKPDTLRHKRAAAGQFVVSYNGSVSFEPMHGSPSQKKRWAKNREEVYAASEMHFMRALRNGKVDDQGFRVLPYLEDTLKHQRILSHIPMPCNALLHPTDQQGLYAFGTKYKALYVEYNPKHRFHENDAEARLENRTNFNSSVISFASPYLYFDENGWVTNPKDVTLLGVWENYRVAGMLPADYEPVQDNGDLPPPQAVVQDTTGLGKQLMGLKNASDTLNAKYAAEKIYIQYDKPYYALNDTIWFKAYLLNEPTYGLSARSGLLHVDLANDSNKVVKQYLLPVTQGLAFGKITLDDKLFKPGNYVLRAYTQWMRNFGKDALYYKNITVTDAGNWLVNEDISQGKQGVNAKLQFMSMDKAPVAQKPLQLQVRANGKNLYKQNVTTDGNGLVNTTFLLPDKTSGATLIAEDKAAGKKAVIPVSVDREKNIDVQFMPEGGSLVAGLGTRVGFKAVASDGKGIDVAGVIVDQNQKQVAAFKSVHNGIGSFELLPEKGTQYSARLTSANGSYPLPAVKASGTFLQVKNLSDSLAVNVSATDSLAKAGNKYFLLVKARGVICYAAVADLKSRNVMHAKLSKDLFPSGIAHVILANLQGQPLNERLVYIDRHDGLHFDVKPEHQSYNPKDSVALHIKVTDKDGEPVVGNFSMAVTDDAQVRADTAVNDNIFSRMLLTSDIKGYVEGPGYYLKDDETAHQALDNLLLTQGWVNYELPAGKVAFEAETEFKVHGRMNNVFNKGLKNAEVVLLSTRPQMVMDTVTDKDGRFTFDRFPRVDTPVFVLKANKRNFNVNIDVEETAPPVFMQPSWPVSLPWYVNPDTTLMRFVKSSAQMQQLQYYPGGGRILKEVKITAKKTVKNSYNPNGPGEADIVVDEKDAEAAGKKTWWQLCEEKIPGFNEILELDKNNNLIHRVRINKKHFILIVNGEMMSRVLPPTYSIKEFLEMHNAEDIKGLEVAKGSKYVYGYLRMYFASEMIDPDTVAFVEITTRSGDFKMPFTPGTYLYKPLALSWPKQFYKPKYTIKDTTNLTDLRSTIDWEPNISTNKNGEATVWFYAAGAPSGYNILIEGVDGNGLLGYKRQKLLIAKPKPDIGK